MPVLELTDDTISQHCSVCGADRHVALTSLLDGRHGTTPVDVTADVVRLPPCEGCGGVEFLIRSAETEPPHPSPGSFGHLHRLLVDELHSRLVQQRAPSALKELTLKTPAPSRRGPTQEELQTWFPQGLRIQLPDSGHPTSRGVGR